MQINIALEFIKNYRALEEASISTGYELIRTALAPDNRQLRDHLCSHWRSKEKAFGAFFVNLSSRNQIKILHQWGIVDPADQAYLSIEELQTEEYLNADSPRTREILHNLIVFFLNHGISERPTEGLELDGIPSKTFGNSANWGDYILGHSNPERVLSIILGYVEANIPKKTIFRFV